MAKFQVEVEFDCNNPTSKQVIDALNRIALLIEKNYVFPGENWGTTTISFDKFKTQIKYKTKFIQE